MRLQRARLGKRLKIGRVQTRLVPYVRQRAVHKDIQLRARKQEDELRAGPRRPGEQKMSLKLEPNYRKVQQKVYERIMYHSFFGEFKDRLQFLIMLLALLDTGLLQSLPQLVVYLLMIGVLLDRNRGGLAAGIPESRTSSLKESEQAARYALRFRAVASLLQVLLIS